MKFRTLIPLVGALCALAACSGEEGADEALARADGASASTDAPLPLAPPVDGEGEESHEERQEWLESMHRAAPDVDWRAIEDRNRLALLEARHDALQNPALGTASWDEIGSRNLAGSTFVTVPSSDGQELYLGSALGGVFRGPAAGNDWTAISDGLYGGAHHLVVIEPASGTQDVILRSAGARLWRSTDGGTTWTQSLAGLAEINRLLRIDDAGQTVLAVSRSGVGWFLYRSTNRGAGFQVVRNLSGTGDVWTPRDALGDVYLFDGDRLYRSTDAGMTFSAYGNPLGFTPDDVHLGGHESSNGQTFSLAARRGGTWELWRTTDGGATWTHPRDMPEMWNAFATSIHDENLLAYGGVELWVSRDGGANFSVQNYWWEHPSDRWNKLHADIMGVSVEDDPATPTGERWFINTHGGTYESVDQLGSTDWITGNTLGVSQYYSTHTSRRHPEHVQAGSQDQGYQRSALGTPGSGPGPWADFSELITGDYGHLSSSDGSHDLVYSDYPGFVLIAEGETNPVLHTADFPTGFAGQWLPYLVADPEDPRVFFLLGEKIWRYERVGTGGTWSYQQHGTRTFSPVLTSLAFSPVDPDKAWCCTSNGTIYWSDDRGVTWTQATGGGPGAHYFYGTTIVPSSTNADEVWIAGSGYSAAGVQWSGDGGQTWTARDQGLPPTLVYDLCEAVDSSGRMYAAAETGAWEWDPATGQWASILGAEAPVTTYWSVEGVPSQNVIRFGTYGRGIWDYAPGTPGFFPYGELRDAPNVLTLSGAPSPTLGTPVTLRVEGGLPGASGWLTVSKAADERAYYGGDWFVDNGQITHQLPVTADGLGVVTKHLQVPNNPAIVGVERFLQARLDDPAMVRGLALSNGLRVVFGQ